jgi:hypothetical protein
MKRKQFTLANVLERLPVDNNGRARCPAHVGHHGSTALAVWEDQDGALGLKCWSHGCTFTDILSAIRELPVLRTPQTPSPTRGVGNPDDIAEIWNATVPAERTPVSEYLRARGITAEIPPTVRYHQGLLHSNSGRVWPAMVCAVSNGFETHMAGIHRTYLTSNGSWKAPVTPNKMRLGSVSGGTVRCAPAEDRLIICEGVEEALFLQQELGIPAWATLGVHNLPSISLPPLPLASEVCIDVEPETVAEEAAQRATERFRYEGRRIRHLRAPEGAKDFNDLALKGVK